MGQMPNQASRDPPPPGSGQEEGPARIPAERTGPQSRAASDAHRAAEPRCRPAAAGQPSQPLTGTMKQLREADPASDLTRPRRTAGPCGALESTLRHRPLAVLFHEPEVSRRIHDLHLGTPRFPLMPRRTEVVDDNVRTKAQPGHRETMQSADGIDLHFDCGLPVRPFREASTPPPGRPIRAAHRTSVRNRGRRC